MDLAKLSEPFPAADIDWRIQTCGKGDKGFWARCLAYITSRAVMDRLDAVCGPENWQDKYITGPQGGVVCRLAIRIGEEWVEKQDGAENTKLEPVKGGLSDSMKRAAVKWGIGRYLYNLEEGWATCDGDPRRLKYRGKTKEKQGGPPPETFSWDPPLLPEWALPEGEAPQYPRTPPSEPAQRPTDGDPKKITEKQAGFLHILCSLKSTDAAATEAAIYEQFKVERFRDIPYDGGKKLIDKMVAKPDVEKETSPDPSLGCPECGETKTGEGLLCDKCLDKIPF